MNGVSVGFQYRFRARSKVQTRIFDFPYGKGTRNEERWSVRSGFLCFLYRGWGSKTVRFQIERLCRELSKFPFRLLAARADVASCCGSLGVRGNGRGSISLL